MHGPARHRHGGFTLIELIIVMALLATMLALALPKLNGFMTGRDLTEETRRLLALTRLARQEAVSRGQRMELWFDTKQGRYGLRSETTYGQDEVKPLEYKLADKLGIQVSDDDVAATDKKTKTKTAAAGIQGETSILFWPDGSIDEDSPTRIVLTENGKAKTAIKLSINRIEFVAEEADNAKS
jgi:type II secretion system protein H